MLVRSSHGTLSLDPDGTVLKNSDYWNEILKPILRFDMEVFDAMFPDSDHDEADILDMGYWYWDRKGKERYQAPQFGWREQ